MYVFQNWSHREENIKHPFPLRSRIPHFTTALHHHHHHTLSLLLVVQQALSIYQLPSTLQLLQASLFLFWSSSRQTFNTFSSCNIVQSSLVQDLTLVRSPLYHICSREPYVVCLHYCVCIAKFFRDVGTDTQFSVSYLIAIDGKE